MSLVALVSGGLDSTLMAVMAREEGITQYPLFIDYGQIFREREWEACCLVHNRLGLPQPKRCDLGGFGSLISSGLTDPAKRVNEDAFLPGRNLLFLLVGAAYAYQVQADAVGIGLLDERSSIYPDQTQAFLDSAQWVVRQALATEVCLVAPLMNLTKADVLRLTESKGICGTYSCHSGGAEPCGQCVSCLEVINAKHLGGERHGR